MLTDARQVAEKQVFPPDALTEMVDSKWASSFLPVHVDQVKVSLSFTKILRLLFWNQREQCFWEKFVENVGRRTLRFL